MTKIDMEMYEGLPVIEASNCMELQKNLAMMKCRPNPPYAIRISDSSTRIDRWAFWDLKFFRNTNDIAVVVITDSVTVIGAGAFSGFTGLTSIVIPDSVKKIGKDAFSGCTALTSIAIPNSVTKIGWFAFSGCWDLTSIIVPDSVTEIGYGAFKGCTRLEMVSILGAVKNISDVFSGCTSLETVTLGVGIKEFAVPFCDCKNLRTINVPAKNAEYYKRLLPEHLHALINELPAENKVKK